MAEIQVYDTAKSEEIEASAVVNGSVQGDGTILFTQNDGTTLPGNPVIGPKGPTGAQGLDSNPLGTTSTAGEVRFATEAEALDPTNEIAAVTPDDVFAFMKDYPVAKVWMTVASKAIAAGTVYPFDLVEFDTHGMYNMTNHNFVIPRDGMYNFFSIFRTSNSTTNLYEALYVNGAQRVNGSYFATQGMITAHLSHIGAFKQGDILDVRSPATAVTNYAASGRYTWAELDYLGPL